MWKIPISLIIKRFCILKADADYWEELFGSSEDQRLIGNDVLRETLKFMIHEAEEDDPELLKFVASLIIPPSSKPINLSRRVADYSQLGQSPFIDGLLKAKTNGFFIEAGGFDGESLSNSLFFELERNWTGKIIVRKVPNFNIFHHSVIPFFAGLLIEALPGSFQILKSKNRKCYAINACIAGSKPQIVKFRIFNMLSGRNAAMDQHHKNRIHSESKGDKPVFIYVPCFSLNTILKAIGVKKVDYFSLDVEGGELDVLKMMKFDTMDVTTFTIEYNTNKAKSAEIIEYLAKFGYKLAGDDGQDVFMIKNPI